VTTTLEGRLKSCEKSREKEASLAREVLKASKTEASAKIDSLTKQLHDASEAVSDAVMAERKKVTSYWREKVGSTYGDREARVGSLLAFGTCELEAVAGTLGNKGTGPAQLHEARQRLSALATRMRRETSAEHDPLPVAFTKAAFTKAASAPAAAPRQTADGQMRRGPRANSKGSKSGNAARTATAAASSALSSSSLRTDQYRHKNAGSGSGGSSGGDKAVWASMHEEGEGQRLSEMRDILMQIREEMKESKNQPNTQQLVHAKEGGQNTGRGQVEEDEAARTKRAIEGPSNDGELF